VLRLRAVRGCRAVGRDGSNPVLHNSLVASHPGFSVKPTLTGDTVVLRPFTADDLPCMLQALRDPEVLKLTGSVHDEAAELVPENPAEEKKWRDWYSTRSDQSDRLDLAVIDRSGGGCVGEAVLNEWNPGNQNCSFRIALGPRGPRARAGHRGDPPDRRLRLRAARDAPHLPGGVLVQPARPPCL
jgi:hypothetical protein